VCTSTTNLRANFTGNFRFDGLDALLWRPRATEDGKDHLGSGLQTRPLPLSVLSAPTHPPLYTDVPISVSPTVRLYVFPRGGREGESRSPVNVTHVSHYGLRLR